MGSILLCGFDACKGRTSTVARVHARISAAARWIGRAVADAWRLEATRYTGSDRDRPRPARLRRPPARIPLAGPDTLGWNKQGCAGVLTCWRMRTMRMRRAPRSAGRTPGGDPSRRPRPATFDAEALSHVDSLYRTALRLTRSPADAEDLVQDTYLKAFRAADTFEPGTNLRAWLFTIHHNTARNRARYRAHDPVVDSEAVDRAAERLPAGDYGARGAAAPDNTPETLLLRDTLTPELQAAIDALPEGFRDAVWLRDVEEFTYAEIASMLAIPPGTVMSRISRGRRMLFERLNHLKPVNA
jgi:RNA polymerase sigma-70 factor (ECF subfamily)